MSADHPIFRNLLYGQRTQSQIDKFGAQGIPQSSLTYHKGAGAFTAIPTGAPMKAPTYNPQTFKPMQFQNYNTTPVQSLSVNPQQFSLAQQVGTQAIGQGARAAQQDLMRQYGARGMGRSGFALQGAADLYNRGAAQQQASLGNQLSSERMGLEFGERQQARGLEQQRQENMANRFMQNQSNMLQQNLQGVGLSQNAAQQRASLEMQNRAQNLQNALGLGQLGLQGQQLNLQGLQAQRQWEDAPMQYLGALLQSGVAANASGGGGKGK